MNSESEDRQKPENVQPDVPADPPAPAGSKKRGRPPGANAEKILADAMVVLKLKAQGITDETIKKTLGIRERDYERRLKAIRENKLLHRQAQHVCQEIVLRLFALRNNVAEQMDGLKARDHFHRVKHAQVILEAEQRIFDISKQLGYWPPPVDAPLQAETTAPAVSPSPQKPNELEGGLPPLETLSDEQLRQHVESLTQKA